MVMHKLRGVDMAPGASGDGTCELVYLRYPGFKPSDMWPDCTLLKDAPTASLPREGTAVFRPLNPSLKLRDPRPSLKQPENSDLVLFEWKIMRGGYDAIKGDYVKG